MASWRVGSAASFDAKVKVLQPYCKAPGAIGKDTPSIVPISVSLFSFTTKNGHSGLVSALENYFTTPRLTQPVSGQIFVNQWTSAVKTNLELLEPDDRRQIIACGNWEEVQQDIVRSPSQYQEIGVLGSVLQHLNSFLGFVSRQAPDAIDTSLQWGLVKLLIAVGA